MGVTKQQFDSGMTYDEYKAQMNRNKERFEANEAQVTINADDLAFFKSLPERLNLLVLAEDWCGDVISGLPVIGKLVQQGANINVRVFLRDQNLDIMDQYLKEGKFRSIPVFVFFDSQMRQIGYFIERPPSVTDELANRRRAVFAANPDFGSPDTPVDQLPDDVRVRYSQVMLGVRAELAPWMNDELVRALRATVEPARV